MAVSEILGTMIEAARTAGDGLKRDFFRLASLDIRYKVDATDPVTAADLESEETVRRALRAARPEYGFLGEEGGLIEGEDRSRYWLVDPLDGTYNFICGVPLFGINIALAEDGEVIAGVTHLPMLQETYWAEKGGGAWLNGQRIRVSERALIQSVLAVGIPFAAKPRHAQFAAEMQRLTPRVAGIRRLGAGSVDMAFVACGRFDAYWEQSVSAWDMAAGVALIREAGGIVTTTRGEPVDLMGGTVLATTPQLHEALIDALQPIDMSPA